MDAHRGVELGLRGAALERDADALHDLRRVGSDHVRADNLIRGGVHDELHERLLDPPREGDLHRGERAGVDVDGHTGGHGLVLGHAHGVATGGWQKTADGMFS